MRVWGFPGGSVVKNPPVMQERWVQSLGWEDPLEEEMATYSSTPAWKIPWTTRPLWSMELKSQTQLSDWAHIWEQRYAVYPREYSVLGMHRNDENGFFPNINSAWQTVSSVRWKCTPLPQVHCLYGTHCDFVSLRYCDSESLSNKYWAEWFI